MNKDLTVGEPNKVLLRFCLPLFLSVIFQQLYNIADSWVAGRFIGENALASVGNSYEITLIFIAFAFGCNIGCSVITSRYFGAKDYSNMKTTILTSMIATVVTFAILMILGLVFSNELLVLIKTPEELLFDSKLYLNIYIYGLPFIFIYNLVTGIFSALGDSKTPFIFLAISSTSNIFLDILFVKEFNLGVSGLAWATFICQALSALVSLIVIYVRLNKIKIESFKIFDFEIFKSFLKIAIPSTLQQSFISIGNIIIQGVINGFGAGVMAGYSAGIKLNNLVITSFTTLGNGISNYTSQNIGAKKYDRVHDGFKAGIKLIWALAIPLAILYFFFPKALLGFFLENPSYDAITSGVKLLRIIAPFYLIISIKLISDGILRGASKMKQFMTDTFTDLILRVVLAIILSKTALGYVGIWTAWPIGWTIATVLSVCFYKRIKFK